VEKPGYTRGEIRDSRTIMVRNQTQLGAEILAKANNLIGIGRMGVGLDNIDVEAATNAASSSSRRSAPMPSASPSSRWA